MADDELVIGFSDSEWTGIAPILEEDVAMSSLAQDELGHAQALYQLLAQLRDQPPRLLGRAVQAQRRRRPRSARASETPPQPLCRFPPEAEYASIGAKSPEPPLSVC